MTRSLRVFLPVAGDATALRRAFTGDPVRWLPEARHLGPGRWRITVRAGQLSRAVEARIGAPWRSGGSHWRSLSWDPVEEPGDPVPLDRLLPSLDGELGLHILDGVVTMILDARYLPPGGPLGAAIDAAALHRVARSTAERLLGEVAAHLTSESLLTPEVEVPDDEGASALDAAHATKS